MFENATIVFAFAAMIAWGVGDFLVQKTVRKLGNFETLIWINFIAGLGLLPFVLKDIHLIKSLHNFLWLLLLGVIDFFFGLILLKAYEKGKLSVVEAVMIFELPLTIILGIVFFSEKLTLLQFVCILTILSGIFSASKKHRTFLDKIKSAFGGKINFFEKGAILALAAAALSAFYNFFIAINSREVTPIIAIWFPWVFSLMFLLLYVCYKKGFPTFLSESAKYKNLILWTGIINTAAWVFYSVALKDNALSITTAITESYIIISIYLGLKINKEKISIFQYLGSAMALVGSLILGFIS